MIDQNGSLMTDMIEKLAKIQEEVKYAQIIKIQNNIQSNSDITSAGSKVKCQVDTCQTYHVQSLSVWTSEKETYRVDFSSNDRFSGCTCLSFRRKRVLSKHFFLVIENGYLSFTDVSQMYRNHPFIILDEERFQAMNDSLNTIGFTQLAREGIKGIKEYVSCDERQQEDPENVSLEVISSYAPLPSRESAFKVKKMKLLSNIKILTEKVYCIKNSHSSEDFIDAVNSSVLEVLTDVDRHLTERNDLFIESAETESKKENWKKISKKRKAKATQAKAKATIPNKFQLKHPYSKRVGTTADMMKQFYRARISLRDMEKYYTVSTINQANKETPCLQTSSIIVAQTIEVNTTNCISKLETENINENIKNSSSDHPDDSNEIEYVKTIPGTSI